MKLVKHVEEKSYDWDEFDSKRTALSVKINKAVHHMMIDKKLGEDEDLSYHVFNTVFSIFSVKDILAFNTESNNYSDLIESSILQELEGY